MAVNFTGNVALKEKILRVLQANELRPGVDPYTLTYPPGGNSGWSFGQVQFDLGSNNAIGRTAFKQVLLEAKDSAGQYLIHDNDPATGRGTVTAIQDKRVLDLYTRATMKPSALTSLEVVEINAALGSAEGRQVVDNSVDLQLTDLIKYADGIIQKAPVGDQAFLRSDIGYLWLVDLKNQGSFGLQGFLTGKPVNGYTKSGTFTFDDLVNVYFRQRERLIERRNSRGERVLSPWDPFRRISNIIKETGYTPVSLDEARGIVRAYTYLYVRYENELLETSGRAAAVQEFRTMITKPAENLIFANWKPEWGPVPTSYDDILMGDDNANNNAAGDYRLNGRDGNDIIFGEGGNDHIEGGKGNDILLGGTGHDTYIYTIGDGNDRIIDEDKDGEIIIFDQSGTEIKRSLVGNFYKSGTNQWAMADGSSISVTHNSPWRITLADGGTIDLGEDFQDGDFGIHLLDMPTTPDTTTTITGDLTPTDFDPNRDGVQMQLDELDNVITDPDDPMPGRSDKLYGGSGNDRIEGKDGNDFIYQGEGDDWVLGGEGRDSIGVKAGELSQNDIVEGGAGADIIFDADGDDQLFGENKGDMADLIAAGETAEGINEKGDLIGGGEGNDYIYGAERNDALFGGKGRDLIVAGGGDDFIAGGGDYDGGFVYTKLEEDGSYSYAKGPIFDWTFAVNTNGSSFQPEFTGLSYIDTGENDSDGDAVYAGTGNDFVYGTGGSDDVYAGAGNDIVFGWGGRDVIIGGDGDDILVGDNDTSVLSLDKHGEDYIDGGAGNDVISGGGNSDTLFGGDGIDQLAGDAGDDYLDGEAGNDYLWGGEGNDQLEGGDGIDALSGDAGDDYLNGGSGADSLYGDVGNDELFGGDDNDWLEGNEGDDYLDGEAGDDILLGGDGIDQLQGGDGNDHLQGDAGDDYLDGEAGNDTLIGLDGNDEIYGGDGNDELQGNEGADYLEGGLGDDTVAGGSDNDVIYGGDGNDTLLGEAGDDYLEGNYGDDVLAGGAGHNVMTGGAGVDIYHVDPLSGTNEIYDDFSSEQNAINVIGENVGLKEVTVDADGRLVISLKNINGVGGDAGQIVIGGVDGLDPVTGAYSAVPFSVQDLQLSFNGTDVTLLSASDTDGDGIIDLIKTDRTYSDGIGTSNEKKLIPGGGTSDRTVTISGPNGSMVIVDNDGDGRADDIRRIVLGPDGYMTITVTTLGPGGILPGGIFPPLDGLDPGSGVAFAEGYGNGWSGWGGGGTGGSGTGGSGTGGSGTGGSGTGGSGTGGSGTGGSGTGGSGTGGSGTGGSGTGGSGTGGSGTGGSGTGGGWGGGGVGGGVGGGYGGAQSVEPRRDPLTLDLDGDGLETVGINTANPILFDHDGDGVKTATGWIKPDDGFLVLDRNGNGTIDGGTELFGDSTPLLDENGNVIGKAEDGFAALAQEDTNGDGIVDANDARFADLRVWHDLNSDGVSQEGELQTLDEAGIAAIHVGKTEHSQQLGNGNLLADLGSYVRTDGSTGGLGAVTAEMGDIDLAENTFYSQFTDSIPLTEEARNLPDMSGSGQVRTMREAASLSPTLAVILSQYVQATTRAEQMALLDQLIIEWGKTSELAVTGEGAYGGVPTIVSIAGEAKGSAGSQTWMTKLQTLERFNGRPFATPPTGAESVFINLFAERKMFLNQAWDALRQSVYDSLLLQTRLKPYLDAVSITVSDTGVGLDFSGTGAVFQTRHDQAPGEAVRDLLDLQRIVGTHLTALGWDGYEQLRGWLAEAVSTTDPTLQPTLVAALADFGYPSLRISGDGTGSSEVVIGSDEGAVLNGGGGNDLVLGGDGNDTLSGGSGNDTLYGGAGDDTYRFNLGDGADTIIETHGDTGSDALEFGAGILAGDITISVEGDKLVFAHSNGRDRISIANWFNSMAGAHRIDFVRFADGSSFDLSVLQLGTAESNTLAGAVADDIHTGAVANDILLGNDGNDTLSGQDGNDWLDGGSGADQMTGGTGDDIYVVDNAGDVVTEAAGEGIDTVDAKISATLGDNLENLRLVGTGWISGTGNELDNVVTGNSGNNTLQGLDGSDSLSGNAGDDTLLGGAGNDTLAGGDGSDWLDGGAGNDAMAGGSGNDSYVVDTTGDSVTEYAGQGSDTVYSGIDYTLGDNLENLNLTGTAPLNGTGNALDNVIIGNSGDNTLVGLDGSDTLNGGGGADAMLGETGNDTYVVDNDGDAVIENTGEGTDLVQSGITYTLTDSVENLTLTGGAAIDGTGNELANTIVGNSGNNTLSGLDGNDWLDGGSGADTMLGATGDDSYVVDNAGDVVLENAGEGTDTVRSSIGYTLGENLENLTLIGGSSVNGTGNELDNVLVGNYGNNVLDGRVGADFMAGGSGNDTYLLDNLGDTVSEQAWQGVDTVVAPFDYTLGANVDNLTLTGEALNGTGNVLDNVINGTAADNTLIGLDGNDTLNGGAGADTMIGGRGNDSYQVDNLLDTTTELAGEGIDTVSSSLTWTLADSLDNLTLTGTAANDGTGNELDNVIIGNSADNTLTALAGNDTLDGGAGADLMLGGTGNDGYVVDNAGDAVVENAGEETDSVRSSITYTLTDNVENLTLTGTDAIDGTGNELDNTIIGNSGNNTLQGLDGNDLLNGGSGADAMLGGAGDDIYVVDNAGDSVTELAGEGTDTVQSSVNFALSQQVEHLVLTGGGNISGTGNELDNSITGNSGANLIDGGLGIDTMAGGAGNDSYVVNDSADLVIEQSGAGNDSVFASASYTLSANVENLTLTGSADLDGTGNSLDNVITGNSGNNLLLGLDGNDILVGNAGDDLLYGEAGSDTLLGGEGNDVLDGAEGDDSLLGGDGNDQLDGGASNDSLQGGEGSDLLFGGDGNDELFGNEGDDFLDGGLGSDKMTGGAGDDIYLVDSVDDVVTEVLGEGTDTVLSSVSYTLADTLEHLTLTGSAAIDGTGNGLDNIINGNSGDNMLSGLDGNDTLSGAAGNDLLDGGTGADAMAGGTGDDFYLVDQAGDTVSELSGEGIDTVESGISYTLTDNVENLILTGAALDGTGNALDNRITATGADNTLDGGAGVDTMIGGAGSDTYLVDDSADLVVELAGEGVDTVYASASYALSDNLENLTLTGTDNIDGTGNALANTIIANSGVNILAGMGGNDTYFVDGTTDLVVEGAGEGVDTVNSSATYTLSDNVENLTLTGTADIDGTGNALANTIIANSGVNILTGLGGDDNYIVDATTDVVVENAGEGTDTIYSSAAYRLSENVENLTLTGSANIDGIGNDLNNIMIGNSGANLLDGGTGADSMVGGAGNDSYIVDNAGDIVTESANAGIDIVSSSVTHTLSANVENLTLTGSADIDGTGNTLNNELIGNSGVNKLDGGAGADTMAGGAGDDTYIVDNAVDVVTEAQDEGIDSIQSSVSYTLSANVENLTLTGSASINGTGNGLDNVIIGNSGNNVLSGLAGNDTLTGNAGNDTLDGGLDADTMTGGAGNDVYVVDNTGDLVTESLNEGADLVQSSISYALTSNVENLTLTGTANIAGTGNALNNVINGNSGANILDGGAGADAMAGGGGNDTYIVDNNGDAVTEAANAGIDIVYSSVTQTLSANVENLTLTGTANIDGTGNELNNIIIGNTANNRLYGMAGNDTISGQDGNDLLDGGTGADAMAGNADDDTYVVDNAGDLVSENLDEGTDLVQSSIGYTLTANVENLTLTGSVAINGTGNALNNVIVGNSGNNVLSGLTGNDTLTGNAGNDTLDGGLDSDTMTGGAGNDTYVVDNAGDLVTEALNEGTDLVQSSITYTLTSNVENLTQTGTADINGTGNTLNNIIIGNSGANILSGDSGNDTITAGAGNDTIYGGDGNDSLTGDAGNDVIFGDAGNDLINGGLDADSMAGGTGDDTYIVDNVGDVIAENLSEGIDLVQSSVTYTLSDNVENLTLTGTASINGTGNVLNNIITGNSGANVLTALEGNDTINAGSGSDTLYGGDGNDTLNGEAGNDLIFGDASNDTINGGLDVDTMLGGTGDDTYIVDNTSDVVTEALDEGTDLVQSSVSHTLSANVENLTLTGTASINGTGNGLNNIITGNSGNNVLSGLAGNDTLIGNSGNDTLDGGLDVDTMTGGAGNDTYVVDNAGDLVTENLNQGTDLVQSSITYTLTANVENLTLTGTADIDGTGNVLNNVITGNSGTNILSGLSGNDTITAGAGADTIFGGDGNDSLTGDAGNDVIFGEAGNDTLNGGLDADTMAGGTGDDTYVVDNVGDLVTENPSEGADLVQSSITYTLTDNVENLTLTGIANINGTGNVLNNIITGNSGANVLTALEGNDTINAGSGSDTLYGGDGNDSLNGEVGNDLIFGDAGNDIINGGLDVDTMVGGTGDDTYVVDNTSDVVTEASDEGTDLVQSSVSYTLSANVENLTLTGTSSINGTGNSLNNVITGNSGNNVLSGLAGNDTLIGNSGNDTLDGGLDVDTMTGGAGNDTYVVDNAGDLVTENLNQGTDLVQSSITYTLTANVENLTLTGTEGINGTGNTLANTITGNSGANILDGGAGADTMIGGAGDDTYFVDNTSDVIAESAGGGTDTVFANATYTLSADIENLTLTGTANINGTGNAGDNVILGNSGANTLNGAAGNDTLIGAAGADTMAGGAGDDTYVVESSGDVVVEAANAGIDLVQSGISYTLTDNVENLTLTGTGNLNATGNALNNILSGTSGSNILNGGAGADTMIGGAGDDVYIVDNTADVVTENLDDGTETIQSSASYTLSANVENLILSGTAGITGTGNDLDNVIAGNNGGNVLSGLGGNDTLIGNAGNDLLDGGAGADSMAGGLGDDTYVVDSAEDVVIELAGEGTDTVQSSIAYTLGVTLENLTLTGTSAVDSTGNEFGNVLVGNDGNNALYGLDGNDTLIGNGGDDLLDGGTGADIMAGGKGDDTYLVENAGDLVTEGTDGGVDSVRSDISYTLTDNVENLVLTGTRNLDGAGNVLDNVITGTSGANAIDGGAGVDTMIGGAGDDTYIVDSTADTIMENAGEEVDSVYASATYTLSDNVENLTLTGNADIDGTGNALANTIVANSGVNTLAGKGGDDTYIVDSTADAIVESAGEGVDGVYASATYTLSDNIESLTLTGTADINGTGNALANAITGNSGANILDGGAGADTMAGVAGDDIYIADDTADVIVENAGEGTDTVYSSVSHVLSDNVENLTLTGADNIDGTGNVLANLIKGNSGDNVLAGLDGNDTLVGNEGNDLLDGGAGADTMAGGMGNDSYVVDEAGDIVTEGAGEGIDTVVSSISYTLGENVENLTLTGSADLSGTGNGLDNVVTGNDGNNSLDGGDGNDTLAGGSGADLLLGGAGNDRYVFNLGDGSDRIADVQGDDTLFVGSGLTERNLKGDRVGNDMLISVVGAEDSITLTDWFVQAEGVNTVVFEDGSMLDHAGIELLLNRPPVANADHLTVYEDGGALTLPAADLLANDTDPNPGDILSVVSIGESSIGVPVALANGELSYDIGNRFQELAAGEVLNDSFAYTISDDKGATATGVVEVGIIGVNDAPVVTPDSARLTEDMLTSATGNVLANDSDIDAGTVLRVSAPGTIAGTYGTLSVAEDGSYNYSLDNSGLVVQSLGRTAEVVDHFNYTATDDIVGTPSTLDFFVSGINDAPVVVKPLADQDFTFNKPFAWQMPADSFIDVDQGDKLDYAATLADGSPLPEWLKFDAASQTFSGWTPKEVGFVDIRVTATDRVAATGSTEGSLSVSDVFRLSVSHGNQGVGNGEDAAPAGQDVNWNDGPGTAPGRPGAASSRRTAENGSDVLDTAASSVDNKKDVLQASGKASGYLDMGHLDKQLLEFDQKTDSNQSGKEIFVRWQAMNRALAEDAAGHDNGVWHRDDKGADIASLGNASAGFLGSTHGFGSDGLTLAAGSGTNLQGFKGLKEGMRRL